MIRKVIVCILMMMLMISTSLVSAQSFQTMTVLEKTAAAERIVYGIEQTGSLIERTGKLEKDIYGSETKFSLTDKLDRIYTYLNDNSAAEPSFQAKLNAVEWTISHSVTTQAAVAKIDNLETILLGTVKLGNLDERMTRLTQIAYPNGRVNVSSIMLNKDTLIKIKTVTELNSKKSRTGDTVVFQAAEDVYSSGLLVIPKGAQGIGKITKVQQARNFGRDAVMEVSFDNITAFDSTLIQTEMGDKAKEETKSLAKAAGASVAGMALLGPIGVVGGAFVHGSDVTIPPGTEMYIQVKADINAYGLQVK